MGRRMCVVAAALWLCAWAVGAAADDPLVGTWVTQSGKSRVEITQSKGKYAGTIVWLKTPNYPAEDDEAGTPILDRENRDKKKQKRTLKGLTILKNCVQAGKGQWTKGTIYDPDNGKTYKCNLTLKKNGVLNVRGYIGISLIGRTSLWTRYRGATQE